MFLNEVFTRVLWEVRNGSFDFFEGLGAKTAEGLEGVRTMARSRIGPVVEDDFEILECCLSLDQSFGRG